uniref:Uncharacterized protein n=1 Tax=Meloidogyne enterolobii TaxID=390850 RepID=A0A6V7W061_MELEN|nr:unnamed protein product [Meloidogyne enterolobii]
MLYNISAIIENPKVEIYGIQQKIFDWLKLMGQQFALGIAEFSLSGGAFPLFEEIGLKKYIAATSTIPFPIYLHFFGQELYYLNPGMYFLRKRCEVILKLETIFMIISRVVRQP